MRAPVFAAFLVVACSPDAEVAFDGVDARGDLPADVDASAITEAWLESGADFGVIVDPATGDVMTLQPMDRAILNSPDFTQIGNATCVSCGGVNSTCTGPAGFVRQVDVSLVRSVGSGIVDVQYAGGSNWTPGSETCNGGACPALVDASGGPASLDLSLVGSLNTCSSFGVFFDTVEPVTTVVPGLDGVALSSTFEVSAQTPLPTLGWTNVFGSGQVFDLVGPNGGLIGFTPYDNYTLQYVTGTPILPNSTYTLDVDVGFIAALTGGTSDYEIEVGTFDGATFTSLATATDSVTWVGNLSFNFISGHETVQFSTGPVVSGDPLAVQLGQVGTSGPPLSDYMGFDNVILTVTN